VKLAILDPLLAWKVASVLRRFGRFDVIHAHHVEGLVAARIGRSFNRIPIVFDAHTMLTNELPYYRIGPTGLVLRRAGKWIDRVAPKLADHVVAVSEKIQSKIVRIGAATKDSVTVVPNGAEIDRFFDINAATVPSIDGLIVFTGNLASYQGIDLLLQAMVLLRRERPNARLRIVTQDASNWPAVMARDLGISEGVELAREGFDEVPGELSKACVAVSPRIDCDGVPQKILNYMAAGKATVAFAGSARHIENGVNGLIVPNGDTRAFAHAIRRLLDSPAEAEKMGRNARHRVQQELSWTRSAAQIEHVYSKVVSNPTSIPVGGPTPSWVEPEKETR
jgi:glycosyltransferase involved in cell wall biosynthesis